MNKKNTTIYLATGFTLLSVLIYLLQNLIFHKTQDTFFYLLQDLAFVPIQVLLVTLFINRFLNIMENRKKVKKINVIISAFFAQSGQAVVTAMAGLDQDPIQLTECFHHSFRKRKPAEIRKSIQTHNYKIQFTKEQLEELSCLINGNRDFLLSMLTNPSLLEHDSFTDMLWAVFHVGDELSSREDLSDLPKVERDHIANDIQRAYAGILFEWIQYMGYLQAEYPFLYALAIKKNPL